MFSGAMNPNPYPKLDQRRGRNWRPRNVEGLSGRTFAGISWAAIIPVVRIACACAVALSLVADVPAAELAGKPRVIYGDTIEIGGQPVHLFGIDAPEEEKTRRVGAREKKCEIEATNALAHGVAFHSVTCRERGSEP